MSKDENIEKLMELVKDLSDASYFAGYREGGNDYRGAIAYQEKCSKLERHIERSIKELMNRATEAKVDAMKFTGRN